ncbi:PP2C family protein-serine/threonine phosphatase [Microtetraspora fusca]|uniref:PP2C family protein-serine/threonine phosphatase n=1 Tax=Microtetraspora fusca TaxID=1997 RepID=A0ABW6VJC0_MICFU|nr:PP2C family protein-serine/threonine phosphatase [Microtetraspora fusca]
MRPRRLIPHRHRPWQASDALLAFPLGLIAAIVVADLLTPIGIPMGPLLVVAPAITASFAGALATAMVAAIAVVGLVAVGVILDQHLLSTMYFQSQIISLVVVSVIVTTFRYLRDRRVRELAQVRTVSEAAQRVVLRPLPQRLGPLRVASVYLAAQEQAQIGGDLYAAARTADATRLIVGDVMGKGLTAISDAALLLYTFREAAHRQASLSDLVTYLDRSVCWNLAESSEPEKAGECFITAAVVDIPDTPQLMRMVTCGHPPPLLIRGRQVTTLHPTSPAPPLGLGELTTPDYRADTFALEPGDLLLLYTDGVIEARSPGGVFYPLAERAASWCGDSPSSLVHHLRADLLAHVGGRVTDDAAMIAIQRAPDH